MPRCPPRVAAIRLEWWPASNRNGGRDQIEMPCRDALESAAQVQRGPRGRIGGGRPVSWTSDGLKLLIERSRTVAEGEGAEIAIPRGRSVEPCPVTALKIWLTAAEIKAGPCSRKTNRGGKVEAGRLTPDGVRQILLKRATQAGVKETLTETPTPHGMRAGSATASRTKRSWVTPGTAA
jgi:hypothetical protein